MRCSRIVALMTVGLLAPHAAFAWPVELRFGAIAPQSPFTTGSCEAKPAPGDADSVWHVAWLQPSTVRAAHAPAVPAALELSFNATADVAPASQPTPRRPVAVDYSRGYEVRQKIHKYASIATVPLFVAETWLGQSLYNNPGGSESTRSAHGAVAASIGVLFGVNSVTGVWNLVEGRKNPAGRTRRTVHGILMLVADAGFVATAALAPDEEGGDEGGHAGPVNYSGQRSTHRAVALTSMGVALASYVMMLVWRD